METALDGARCAIPAVGVTRVRYRVTSLWIRSVLYDAATDRRISLPALQPDFSAFADLLVLLRHGTMESDESIDPDPGLARVLDRSFLDVRLKRFVSDARALDGGALSIRNSNVCLKTDNAITASFRPPSPAEVRSSLGVALRLIHTVLRDCAGDPARIGVCAFIGSQILLTIHPFSDGNGRTARMFYAAQLLHHRVTAPSALLGMMLMYRAGGHLYHQASWALRAGDVRPMTRLYVDSLMLAGTLLPEAGSSDRCPKEFLLFCRDELRVRR